MMYNVDFTGDAKEDLITLKKSEINAYNKAMRLIVEF
jgi:mRNA-degrading endonuclease RelE of RelBE toxin-antitoxin system